MPNGHDGEESEKKRRRRRRESQKETRKESKVFRELQLGKEWKWALKAAELVGSMVMRVALRMGKQEVLKKEVLKKSRSEAEESKTA